jgi:tripartite-type tricarboxylate transporter receptor subunit TctC
MSCTNRQVACGVISAFALVIAAPAHAQSVEEFYTGKTINLSIGFTPGGGYDLYGRLVARHLSKHIPGKPAIVAQNMPGAGSMRAAQHLYSIAPKDGTALATFGRQMGITPLLNPAAQYDGTKFTWLGSVTNEVTTCVTWNTSQVKDWDGLLKNPVTFAGDGPGADPDVFANLYNNVFNTKIKIIAGYRGTNPMILAMERGEVDGYPSVFYSALTSTRPTWLPEKKVKLLVQVGLDKEPNLPDVPSALDLARNADDRALIEVGAAPLGTGRPFLMPPAVPADRVAAMRKALAETFADPAFIGEANKRQLDVASPRTGQELQALVQRIYTKTPQDVIVRLRKIMNPGG